MRRVNMSVDRPSCIELYVPEHVRLDRLTPTEADGYVAEQYGALLAPGVTQVPLEAGLYHLRMLEEAQLRVIAGGVQVTSVRALDKDGDFPDPQMSTAGTAAAAIGVAVATRGHGLCGRVPALHVVYATAGAP